MAVDISRLFIIGVVQGDQAPPKSSNINSIIVFLNGDFLSQKKYFDISLKLISEREHKILFQNFCGYVFEIGFCNIPADAGIFV